MNILKLITNLFKKKPRKKRSIVQIRAIEDSYYKLVPIEGIYLPAGQGAVIVVPNGYKIDNTGNIKLSVIEKIE